MIAFVRSVTAAATSSGSMLRSPARTSTKTGVAPVWTITFAVAGQVIGVVITSSPGPIAERDERQVQRRGAGRDGEHVLGLEVLGHPLLELRRARAGRQPAGAQRLGDGGDLLLADRGRLEAELRARASSSTSKRTASAARRARASASSRLVADGEDRARPVGAAAQRPERRARAPVDADVQRRPRPRAPPRLPRPRASSPSGATRKRTQRADRAGLCVANNTLLVSASANASARRSGRRRARRGRARRRGRRRAGPRPRPRAARPAPSRICVYARAVADPERVDRRRPAATAIGACVVLARPDVRERDPEGGRLGGEPVGDRQRRKTPPIENAFTVSSGPSTSSSTSSVPLREAATRRLDRGRQLVAPSGRA